MLEKGEEENIGREEREREREKVLIGKSVTSGITASNRASERGVQRPRLNARKVKVTDGGHLEELGARVRGKRVWFGKRRAREQLGEEE